MPLGEQVLYQGCRLLLVHSRRVIILYGDCLDEIVPYAFQLFPGGNGRANGHFPVDLAGVAGDYRRSVFQGQFYAVVRLAHCRGPQDYNQFLGHYTGSSSVPS